MCKTALTRTLCHLVLTLRESVQIRIELNNAILRCVNRKEKNRISHRQKYIRKSFKIERYSGFRMIDRFQRRIILEIEIVI